MVLAIAAVAPHVFECFGAGLEKALLAIVLLSLVLGIISFSLSLQCKL